MIDVQNMRKLTEGDQIDIGLKCKETHGKGDQVDPNTGGDHSPRLHP